MLQTAVQVFQTSLRAISVAREQDGRNYEPLQAVQSLVRA